MYRVSTLYKSSVLMCVITFVVEFSALKKLLQRLMFGIKCKHKQDVDLILMYIMCLKIKEEYMHVL